MQITGCSALVVGGAGGLGEATVRRLHGAGAKVVVADMADDKGRALESELGGDDLAVDWLEILLRKICSRLSFG